MIMKSGIDPTSHVWKSSDMQKVSAGCVIQGV